MPFVKKIVYSSHQKHKWNPKVVQHGDINGFSSWPFLLNTTQGSSLDLTPDPHHRRQHVHPRYTHVQHTAHNYRQTKRHTSNNEKKGCKLQYKVTWCIQWLTCTFFPPCLFCIVLCFPPNLWYILTKEKKECFVCTNIQIKWNRCEAWFEFPLFWA